MKKAANPTDGHVGQRVRMRRMMQGLSQETLGDSLGITFQQVQKYEKGTNRIGAGRLLQISDILKVPVSFFFEGAPGGVGAAPVDDPVARMHTMPHGLELAQAFCAIANPKDRAALAQIASGLAGKAALLKDAA